MRRIAIVDDDPSVRRAIGRLLRTHGYECVAYDSAESALADSELSSVDCILIDVQLRGMDGFKLRDCLRTAVAPPPHIFVTAHSEQDWPDWQVRLGSSSCLAKPVDDRLLLSEIERLVGAK